jgi:hypothetical protein
MTRPGWRESDVRDRRIERCHPGRGEVGGGSPSPACSAGRSPIVPGRIAEIVSVDIPKALQAISRRSDRNRFSAGDSGHLLFRKPDAGIFLARRRQAGCRNEDAQSAKQGILNFRSSRRNTVAPPGWVHTFELAPFALLSAIRQYFRHPKSCPRRSWRGQTPALVGQERRAESPNVIQRTTAIIEVAISRVSGFRFSRRQAFRHCVLCRR